MATLFKPTRSYPLPAYPDIVDRDGKPHVRVKDCGKTAFYPLTSDGRHYLKPAAKWAADVRFADGTRKRVRFSPNHAAATMMLADLLKKNDREKAGEIDRTAEHRKRPLTAHLTDWQVSLAASGREEDYITLKLSRVRTAFEGCGFVLTPDLSPDRLENYLHRLRTEEGRSIQTTNDWLQAVRQFVRWMIGNGRMERDPLTRLKPGNAKLDQRRRRGEFTPEEIGKLLAAAADSPVVFRGIIGTDRRMIYRLALGTGFRAAELAAIVPDNFDLNAGTPAVILPAEFTKNRKGAVQPLATDVVVELRVYLCGRPAKEPLWPGTWSQRSADMLKLDLDAAGVPGTVDGPEGIEVRDFHALRNCYISDVLRAGADLKQAMTLARHSDPRLTTARYARTRLHDLGAVVNKLPTPIVRAAEPAALRLTGTDPTGPVREQPGAAPGAAPGGSGRVRLRVSEEITSPDPSRPGSNKPPENQGFEGGREQSRTSKAERAGFEPAVGFYPHAALAKRCFRPLSHLSRVISPPHQERFYRLHVH